jgi:hypothetical protein
LRSGSSRTTGFWRHGGGDSIQCQYRPRMVWMIIIFAQQAWRIRPHDEWHDVDRLRSRYGRPRQNTVKE